MADKATVGVEVLVAYDDNTWDTVFMDIPTEAVYGDDPCVEFDREALVSWVERHPPVTSRTGVAYQLYSIPEDQFQEDASAD